MLEKLTFKNHRNQSLDFGKNGLYANQHDLRGYMWKYETENNRISHFTREVTPKTLPVLIACKDEAEGIALKNRLFEIAEADIRAMKPGRIIIGDYSFYCYIHGSKKSDWVYHKGYLQISLSIVTDTPFWIKETEYAFAPNAAVNGLNFNYDFPYDFTSSLALREFANDSLGACDFILTIYGEAVNPSIVIGGHTYQVNTSVAYGEHLIINSKEKTIHKMMDGGIALNCFNARLRTSNIFEKIASGQNTVSWNGDFSFSVKLISERSEPLWT